MCAVAPFLAVHFLGSSLAFMMVYVWARRNDDVRMSFLGLFTFRAPFLPWVLLGFSVLLGNSPSVDLIGIAVGHLYFFLDDVYPYTRAGKGRRPLRAPFWLLRLQQQISEGQPFRRSEHSAAVGIGHVVEPAPRP